MGVFTNCSVLVELKTFPIKEKSSLKAAITENGGTICFVVNKQVRGHDCPCNHRSTSIRVPFVTSAHVFPQCSLILTSDVSSLSTNRLRSIKKFQTPVVGVDYISSCLERGALLPVDGYRLDASLTPAPTAKSKRGRCRLRSLRLRPRGLSRNVGSQTVLQVVYL